MKCGLLCVLIVVSRVRGLFGVRSEEVPVFKSVPTTVKTSENDTVLLPCYVENLGGSIVRWWWDGILLADSNDPNMTVPANIQMFANHTLQVSQLTARDTGEYTCQVVRKHPWGPLQQIHAIEVLYPPSATPEPSDGALEVTLGGDVDIGCHVGGVPKPIVTWYTKGEEIPLLDNRARLQFPASTRQLTGVYKCVASNGVGLPASASIRLRVLYPPEVSAERTWVHASPGVRAELACRVSADPEATVEWLVDGAPVAVSARVISLVSNERHSLLIRHVRVADLAGYTCRATNAIGQNQQTIQLSGVANPAVFKSESRLSADTNYTLIWEVDSYTPIIEYNLLFRRFQVNQKAEAWMKLVIPADSNSPGPLHTKSYVLSGLQGKSVYEAMLLSRNRFGWSQPSQVIRFATDGGDLNDDLIIQVLTNVEENQIFPGEQNNGTPGTEDSLRVPEIAAILTARSDTSCTHISTLLVISLFLYQSAHWLVF